MGLLYSAPFENITVTDAAQDIIVIATSSSVPVRLHSLRISAGVTTDVRARVQLIRRTTAGSGGTGITPSEMFSRNSVAAASTVTHSRTTPGTAGDVIQGEQWSLLVPLDWTWTPETRPQVGVSGYIALNLVAGTGASRVMSGQVIFEED